MQVNLLFAGAGCGKTTKLLDILEQELKTHKPQEIAYVSFTREGSYVGRDRAIKKFNYKQDDFPYFRTLHSIAFRELKMKQENMLQKKHYKILSEKMGMDFLGYYTEDLINNDDKYLFFNEMYRNNPEAAARMYLKDLNTWKLEYVNKNYRSFRNICKLNDFTDLIEKFTAKNKALPVKIAFIDEAQDLTTLQWRMVWTAFKDCERIYIAGDDNQAIFEWSGADVKYFLNLKANIEILDKSYRLPENILNLSNTIVDRIQNKVDKELKGTDKKGEVIRITELEELNINPDETYMFISRNNKFIKDIEKYLQSKGLLYYKKGNKSTVKKEYEAIKKFEEVRKLNIMTEEDEYKLKPHLKKSVDLTKEWYKNFNWDNEKLLYFREIIANKNFNWDNIKIRVNTIHTVKGGEADNVILLTDITKNVNRNLQQNPDSENRVLYVGITRAKERLYIRDPHSRYYYRIFY